MTRTTGLSFAGGGGGGPWDGCGGEDSERLCCGAIGGLRDGIGGVLALAIPWVDFRRLVDIGPRGLLMSSGKRKEFIAATAWRDLISMKRL